METVLPETPGASTRFTMLGEGVHGGLGLDCGLHPQWEPFKIEG